MTTETLWQQYAAIWSAPDGARAAPLAAHVAGDVRYTDPQGEISGIAALEAYMEGFARAVPGAQFEITRVLEHHGRSLARWRLRDASGAIAQTGASTATHLEDGRLATITGFFDPEIDPAVAA